MIPPDIREHILFWLTLSGLAAGGLLWVVNTVREITKTMTELTLTVAGHTEDIHRLDAHDTLVNTDLRQLRDLVITATATVNLQAKNIDRVLDMQSGKRTHQ